MEAHDHSSAEGEKNEGANAKVVIRVDMNQEAGMNWKGSSIVMVEELGEQVSDNSKDSLERNDEHLLESVQYSKVVEE